MLHLPQVDYSLAQTILRRAELDPANRAIVFEETEYNYAEFVDRIRRLATVLQDGGVCQGDRVGYLGVNHPAFLETLLAATTLGAVFVPLNFRLTGPELEFIINDAGVHTLIADDMLRPVIEPVREALCVRRYLGAESAADGWEDYQGLLTNAGPYPGHIAAAPHDTAVIMYTSGTTGRPKGAMLTHGGLTANTEALHEAWRWSEGDVLLHVLPMFHVHGLFVALHGALRAGATTVALRRFEAADVWRHLEADRATLFMGVPTMYHRLVEAFPRPPPDLSSVRLFVSGSAPLRDDTARRFAELTGHSILQRYGMTEVGMATSQRLDGPRREGTVGVALPGVKVRVVHRETGAVLGPGEIGEVHVRGPSVFAGYWGREAATREVFTDDGWLRSGDLGRLDEAGDLTLVGRAKELVISGGLNVYPKEVETALDGHPDVVESAVTGVPDDDLGERVVAGIVPRDGARVDASDLVAWCREQLAPYKCPKRIALLGELPRNAMGKVQKERLAEHPAFHAPPPSAQRPT